MEARDRIILALDFDDFEAARKVVREYRNDVGMFKVGKQLFTCCGTTIVDFIRKEGGRVFLDLKYHDIPNTVSKAGVEAVKLGVEMFNVHASGGYTMMKETRAAVEQAAAEMGVPRPLIIAVTVLTSLDGAELRRMGIETPLAELARRLTLLTKEAGLDGVVASGQEAAMIRGLCGADFVIVTPGVRVEETKDDQKRTITPGDAVRAGATYIVLGGTVMQAPDPHAKLLKIREEMAGAAAHEPKQHP